MLFGSNTKKSFKNYGINPQAVTVSRCQHGRRANPSARPFSNCRPRRITVRLWWANAASPRPRSFFLAPSPMPSSITAVILRSGSSADGRLCTGVAVLPELAASNLANHRVTRSMRRPSRVYTDTSDFTSIDYGDVISVEDRHFLITSYTKEGRFGVDEQIKPWVPKVVDLAVHGTLSLSNWSSMKPLTCA